MPSWGSSSPPPAPFFSKQSFITLCRHGDVCRALHLVSCVAQHGRLLPNSFFYHLLVGCALLKDLGIARQAHALLRFHGLHRNPFLANHLIRMFDSCGSFSDACKVFSELPRPDVFVWTSLLSALSKHGQDFEQTFRCLRGMHESNIQPDGHAFVASLKACIASEASVGHGRVIHAHVVETGNDANLFVRSALIDLYAKCGNLEDSFRIFDETADRNVVLWSTMIMAYAHCGSSWEVISLYRQMQVEGSVPDFVTYISILKAFCGNKEIFGHAKVIHMHIIECGLLPDECVSNTLIDMYAKCGNLVLSRKVFELSRTRDVVTWSAMIGGYVQHGDAMEALCLFNRMQQSYVEVDRVTCLNCLKACSSVGTSLPGKLIHFLVIDSGLKSDVSICNALIDVYIDLGFLEDARNIFDSMPQRDVATWTTMILGYSKFEQEPVALSLFGEMVKQGIQPDNIVLISMLKACAGLRSLLDGMLIHANIIERSLEADTAINNTLIHVYANCWSLEDACKVFSTMPKQDAITWNAMIAGCFQCNNDKLAWRKYEEMQQEGMEPDNVTFLTLLSACSNRGLVHRGHSIFEAMRKHHGLEPTVDHCNCMVDLLGRIGLVEEAEDVLKSTESRSNLVGWTSLLTHCRAHCNTDVGLRCFHRVVILDPKNSKGYILMSNLFANAGRSSDAEIIEQLRYCSNAWNKPGNAFIAIGNKVHGFLVGEQNQYSLGKLKNLNVQMQKEGYLPSLELAQILVLDEDMQCCLD